MSDRLSQRGGANSTNIQAQTVVVGVSYQDMRDIARDVFRDNFLALRDMARATAEERAGVLIDKVIEQLHAEFGVPPETVAEPGVQSAIFEAQRAYALTGEQDLADVLVRLLVDRTKQDARQLEQVVLQQALEIVPKLTTPQIHTLAVLFLVLRAHFANDEGLLAASPVRHISGLLDSAPPVALTAGDFFYLSNVGCISTVPVKSANLGGLFRSMYPGLFSRGIDFAAIPDRLRVAFWDMDGRAFPKWDRSDFMDAAIRLGIEDQEPVLRSLISEAEMTDDEARAFVLTQLSPRASEILLGLEQFLQSRISLTLTGVAIGHADVQQWSDFEAPLSLFIR